MSVNAISSAATSQVKQLLASGASALEEASETAATTRQEAAHGDRVAIRRLAQQRQTQQSQEPVSANEPGKGALVDHKA